MGRQYLRARLGDYIYLYIYIVARFNEILLLKNFRWFLFQFAGESRVFRTATARLWKPTEKNKAIITERERKRRRGREIQREREQKRGDVSRARSPSPALARHVCCLSLSFRRLLGARARAQQLNFRCGNRQKSHKTKTKTKKEKYKSYSIQVPHREREREREGETSLWSAENLMRTVLHIFVSTKTTCWCCFCIPIFGLYSIKHIPQIIGLVG